MNLASLAVRPAQSRNDGGDSCNGPKKYPKHRPRNFGSSPRIFRIRWKALAADAKSDMSDFYKPSAALPSKFRSQVRSAISICERDRALNIKSLEMTTQQPSIDQIKDSMRAPWITAYRLIASVPIECRRQRKTATFKSRTERGNPVE
jgi:hypothetical protein